MSLFSKFKNNLQKTSNFLSSNILSSFQNKKVDNETLEELEAVLISADISLDVVEKLINSVRKVKTSDQDITKTVSETLSTEIENILQPREGNILEENNKNQKIFIFVGVNGNTLTVNNYIDLLYSDNLEYTLNMADIVEGTLEENGESVSLTKVENFESNPIQKEEVFDIDGTQVGYLMYNQFLARANESLNEVFGRFQSAGITELVLDLRYNGGGSVDNCINLASMITGQFTGDVFAKQKWNSKQAHKSK